jgi:hypothetical protein
MKKDFNTLHRGSDNKFYFDDGTELKEMFPQEEWNCPEAYQFAGIRGYEPMTAKELETEEQQDEKLLSGEYFLEEKFDGTRALVYFFSQDCIESGDVVDQIGWCRVFSRRISKKTNFYAENSNSVPQIRDINVPELDGTILDGEMFINGLPFKEVSSTLNCLWDKAVDRQIEKGFISLHAFDILFYKGIDLRKMTLEKRKKYLKFAVEEADSPYIELVDYQSCGQKISTLPYEHTHGDLNDIHYNLSMFKKADSYPNFYKEISESDGNCHSLSPRAFYEYIVATGGEGLIVKPKNGKYLHKRGWEYSKIKAFLTREMIVMGFSEPTREYSGKTPKDWCYFEGDTPVTKHYYNKQVGNLRLGVLIKCDDFEKLPKNKRGVCITPSEVGIDLDTFATTNYVVMEVCECSGFDDDTRAYFTRNKDRMVGSVVEVKANGIMRDSGRLRHPRYLRIRTDKNAEQCTWEDHIQ